MSTKGTEAIKQTFKVPSKMASSRGISSVSSTVESIEKTLNLIQDVSRSASFLLKLVSNKTSKAKDGMESLYSIQKFLIDWKGYLSAFTTVFEYLLIFLKKTDINLITQGQLRTLLSVTRNVRLSLKNGDAVLTFVILGNIIFRNLLQTSWSFKFSNVLWIALASFLHSQFEVLFPQLAESSKVLTGFIRNAADSAKEVIKEKIDSKMEELKETNPGLHESIQTRLDQLEMATYLPGILKRTAVNYTKKQTKKYMPIVYLVVDNVISSSYEKFQESKESIKEFLFTKAPIEIYSTILTQPWAMQIVTILFKFQRSMKGKNQSRSKL